MRKTIMLLCFFTAATVSNVFAQKQGQDLIDSLIVELQSARIDTVKVYLMSQISFDYSNIDPDKGLKYGTDAYDLARSIKWEKGVGNALYYRGANFLAKSRFPEALNDYLAALKFFEKSGDKSKLAGTLSNIGNIYGYQKKNEKALGYFLKALNINREINPKSNFEAANLGNIGLIYFDLKDYDKARDYILQTIDICVRHNHHDMLPYALVTLSGINLETKENLDALVNSKKAMALARETGDAGVVANCYANTGTAIRQMVMQNNQHLIDSIFRGNRQAALREAKVNLDSAVQILNKIGDQVLLASTYESLFELEEYQGNYKDALAYHKLFKTSKDSVFNADKNEKILQSALEYEFDKKESATKAEQEKKDARNSNIRKSITAALAGALLFLGVVYRQRNRIKSEKKRSDELLLNILPHEVAEELKAKGSADARQFDEVTVMFTDFKGFTQIAEKLSPAELVAEIDACFKAFDQIITRHNIEKIKTIGDSYMCAGGLPVHNETHAFDVVQAAIEIQQFMQAYLQQRKQTGKEPFEIRIGIHTGPVVAGIVGIKKFAYDIWGDTVNIASRMESSGEVGKINISSSTYELVKDKFKCLHRGKVTAKNKGEIDMYFVEAVS